MMKQEAKQDGSRKTGKSRGELIIPNDEIMIISTATAKIILHA